MRQRLTVLAAGVLTALPLSGCGLAGEDPVPTSGDQQETADDEGATTCADSPYRLIHGTRGTDPALPETADGVRAELEMYSFDATAEPPFVNISWMVDPKPEGGRGTGKAAKYVVGDTIEIPSYGTLRVTAICKDGAGIDVVE